VTKDDRLRCPYPLSDGSPCGTLTPKGGWDFCVRHVELRGAELLRDTTERVDVTVSLPRFAIPLGGLSRSEWEAVRLVMCGIVTPDVRTRTPDVRTRTPGPAGGATHPAPSAFIRSFP
jgi:hypothetical protein